MVGEAAFAFIFVFPPIRYAPYFSGMYHKAIANMHRLFEFFRRQIGEHEKMFAENAERNDFVYEFLHQIREQQRLHGTSGNYMLVV